MKTLLITLGVVGVAIAGLMLWATSPETETDTEQAF